MVCCEALVASPFLSFLLFFFANVSLLVRLRFVGRGDQVIGRALREMSRCKAVIVVVAQIAGLIGASGIGDNRMESRGGPLREYRMCSPAQCGTLARLLKFPFVFSLPCAVCPVVGDPLLLCWYTVVPWLRR